MQKRYFTVVLEDVKCSEERPTAFTMSVRIRKQKDIRDGSNPPPLPLFFLLLLLMILGSQTRNHMLERNDE